MSHGENSYTTALAEYIAGEKPKSIREWVSEADEKRVKQLIPYGIK